MKGGIVFLAILLLTGCATGAPAPAPNSTPTVSALPVITRPCVRGHPDPQPATIQTPDGVTLAATFYPSNAEEGKRSGAILLIHQVAKSKESWEAFATFVQECSSFALLAVDLRGHGASGGSQGWDKMPQDIAAAWEALIQRPEVDPNRTAIVGASIGANLALVHAANEPRVKGVVLLSPGLEYHGIKTADPMHVYGRRPVLIVAAQDDRYAADSARKLNDLAEGEHRLHMVAGSAHGSDLLDAQAELRWLILEWLEKMMLG